MPDGRNRNLCFVVPVFNHGPQFARVWPTVKQRGLPTIVVDDGSEAETRDILRAIADAEPQVTLVRHDINSGKGGAVMSGLREAHAQGFTHAFQIDADGQHDLAAFDAFLAASDADPNALIVGYPVFDETITGARRWGRLLTTVWIWIETLSFSIHDGMCGFRIYPLAHAMPVLDGGKLGTHMDFDIEILVRSYWRRIPLVQLPVRTTYPVDGRSNFRMGRDNLLISWMHTRLFLGMLWYLPSLVSRRMRQA